MKACPFCKGVGVLDYDGGDGLVRQSWWCRCADCGAQTQRYYGSFRLGLRTQADCAKDQDARKSALYAWERRACNGRR